jgi:Cft2 family RNA processing exonuclease
MRACIHRGTKEIGGTCVELESQGKRIVLDVGLPLDGRGNDAHNVASHFMHYYYCRVHQTLRVTPAMQAALTDHVREIEELVALLG